MVVLDIITLFITSFLAVKSVGKIGKGKDNLLHYCLIASYLVLCVPIFIKLVYGIPDLAPHVNVEKAMNDPTTIFLYDIFLIVVFLSIYFLSRFIKKTNFVLKDFLISKKNNRFLRKRNIKRINCLLIIMIFVPIFVALFSPSPQIYLTFSYFFTNSFSQTAGEYVFHNKVIRIAIYISMVGICLLYLINDSKRISRLCYFGIFINTWIDGKRTIFLFLLVGILAIDLLKGKYHKNPKKQIIKTLVFVLFIFSYFLIYNDYTGKARYTDFNNLYTFYFSRMSIVQTAIYDRLYKLGMLDYYGQTILFNAFVWVPRSIWSAKPVMYCYYFTSFSDGYSSNVLLPYNLQVCIWAEFISNFGLFGPLISVLFVFEIANITERINSKIVYLAGTCFLLLYSVYGFEHIVIMLFYAWLGFAVLIKLFSKKPFSRPINIYETT